MTKRLVEIDDDLLAAARAQLGGTSIKETVNEALQRMAGSRRETIAQSLAVLAQGSFGERSSAWR
jgi:Arc/MetJ family transcription regulator